MRLTPTALVTLLAAHMSIAAEGQTGIAAGATGPVAQATTADEPPEATKVVKPKYPKAARGQDIGGVVVVEFLIDETGRAQGLRVVQSVPGFDEAAVECVTKWRFKPARKNGKPVPVLVRAPVEFTRHRGPVVRPTEVLESVQPPRPGLSRPIAELETALGSGNPEERATSAWELAGARAGGAALLEHLRQLSRSDPDERVRQGAAWAYYRLEAESGITGPTQAYDEAPTPVRTPRPSLPRDARAQRVGGDVVVDVLISESGEVVHAEVSQSVAGLDESAVECAKAWLFKPARAAGKPVPCVARVSVSFRAYE